MTHREIDNELYLTHVTPYMAEALYKVVDSNREYLRQWLPWVDSNTGMDHTQAFIESALKDFARKKSVTWGIYFQGSICGTISIFNLDWQTRRGEVGYWLAETATRRGVMTRCVKEIEKAAFQDMNLEKLEIRCAEGNTASRGIPEKLKYLNEGMIRRDGYLYGSTVDHVVYGKLKEEW